MATSKSMIVSVPLADLVEDTTLYPRHVVDSVNVTRLVQALEAGATLPPLIADKQSKRLIDGWHRIRAYRKVLGPNGVVDVELRDYPDEGSMLLDAIECNAIHGRQLDKTDMTRCIHLSQEKGVTLVRVAAVLHITESVAEKLTIRVATVPQGSTETIPGTDQVALKRPVIHLAGTQLSEAQARAQPTVPGTSYLLITRQLADAVRLDLANRGDLKLMQALRELLDALQDYFSE
jgi:hypothetical protein